MQRIPRFPTTTHRPGMLALTSLSLILTVVLSACGGGVSTITTLKGTSTTIQGTTTVVTPITPPSQDAVCSLKNTGSGPAVYVTDIGLSPGAYALDLATGKTRWQCQPSSGGSNGTAIVLLNGLAVFTLGDGEVDAVKTDTGVPVWSHPSKDSAPLLLGSDQGLVFIRDTTANATLAIVALDATSGTVKWSYDTNITTVNGYTSYNMSLTFAAGKVVISIVNTKPASDLLVALNENDGSLAWQSTPTGTLTSIGANGGPIDSNGTTLFGEVNDPSKGTAITARASTVFALDATTGQTLWSTNLESNNVIAPLGYGGVIDNVVYARSYDAAGGKFDEIALQASSGSLLWQQAIGDGTMFLFQSNEARVVAVDGMLILNSGNETFALHASNGAIIWDDFLSSTWMSVTSNTLYLAGYDLVAVNLTTGAKIWSEIPSKFGFENFIVSGATIFLVSFSEGLIALNAKDGSKLWTFPFTGISSVAVG